MKHATLQPASFAMLFDPALAQAAAERAAQWNLPRRVCRPLDRQVTRRVNADLAAFDAAVDLAPVPEDEMFEEPQSTDSGSAGSRALDPNFADADEL
jgi:hypothetical protein